MCTNGTKSKVFKFEYVLLQEMGIFVHNLGKI